MRFQIALLAALLNLASSGCQTAPDTAPSDLKVIGGMPENSYAGITLAGSGFQRFNGRKVAARIGGPVPLFYPKERTATRSTRVSGGSFRLDFPDSREVGLYKELFLYFDQDGNGACTPEVDQGIQGATGGDGDPYVYEVEQWMVFPMDAETCRLVESPFAS